MRFLTCSGKVHAPGGDQWLACQAVLDPCQECLVERLGVLAGMMQRKIVADGAVLRDLQWDFREYEL